ncbi:hypothetical protein G9463_13650 [Haloarcula sp. JP-Z28]|uniref:hypothetical protein n=1 Tax=Haloarcula sp. JP-Z28 TaxID=2716715 RepID=UPI0014049DB2|nr:hypothetical protein [Haloarcula sp. JP-Z28]NHN64334.1 hypothetical protein [Haloarcula sp. JP-Z28]
MEVSMAQAQLGVSLASVIFSGVLVAVTYLYWQETKNHTAEMRATREAEFQPVLTATVKPEFGLHNRLYIENTGKGAAHDVNATWGFEHLDAKVEWSIPLISPGQKHKFSLPFTEGWNDISTHQEVKSELEGSDGTVYFDWSCEDDLGNEISDRNEIDVLSTVRSRGGSEFVIKNEQREIRKELEDLTDAVDEIPDTISSLQSNARKVDAVKKELEKIGSANRDQLSGLTGVPDRDIATIVSDFKSAGVVDYDEPEDTMWYSPDAADTMIEWTGYN